MMAAPKRQPHERSMPERNEVQPRAGHHKCEGLKNLARQHPQGHWRARKKERHKATIDGFPLALGYVE
ncbi:MAG TPA: hypothetical protein EYG02_03050 [Henriciella marina]|uniref:hypothetical protein n=1 Tax=Henriciella sp. TaxID=1968823 RepID=UPI0017CACB05|nr:hypothetical protein [Henriciella sp.]HIG23630.1 hypothetical protein [Henriciella sp.]HIK63992.1 hypothetical protein [Henriciella marina]